MQKNIYMVLLIDKHLEDLFQLSITLFAALFVVTW